MINQNHENVVEDAFARIISLRAREVRLGHGSFITMGFGTDQEGKFGVRPQWYFWVYMSIWQLQIDDRLIVHCEDERNKIKESLTVLENRQLIKVEIPREKWGMMLEFEGGITLHLLDNIEEDLTQWMLFTPEEKVLVAGPFQRLSIEDENNSKY